EGALIRLKLGGYHGAEADLRGVEIRKIAVKGGDKFSFTYRYKTRDIIKNFILPEAMALLRKGLAEEFRSARLEATGFDLSFERHGDKVRLKRVEAEGRAAPSAGHDRAKNRPLAQSDKPWLKALGMVGKDGAVRNDAQDKFRQINRMVEIFAPLIQALKEKNPLILDMGAGKGYLDFALYDSLASGGQALKITGVEMRKALVAEGNRIAAESGFSGLSFAEGTILDFDAGGADAVIALHAC